MKESENISYVHVYFEYREDIVKMLKSIGEGKWQPDKKAWIFPIHKRKNLEALKRLLEKDAIIRGDFAFYFTLKTVKEKLSTSNQWPQFLEVDDDTKYSGLLKYSPFQANGEADIALYDDALKKFKNYLIRKGYSKETIKNYNNHLRRYLEFTEGVATVQSANAYLFFLLETKLCSHSYVNQAINVIKIYLKLIGSLEQGDLIEIVRPKKEKHLPKVMSQKEVKGIFQVTHNRKHKTALMMAYSCGLRVSETANLKLSDIDFDRKVVYVKQGKGRKDRVTTLSSKMEDQLGQYYREYRPDIWLFENQMHNGPISSRSLQIVFKDSVRKTEMTKDVSFHSLRHSFATHLLEAGVDIRYIQELLGHANIKTTEIYTHVSAKDIQKIVNPLDRL